MTYKTAVILITYVISMSFSATAQVQVGVNTIDKCQNADQYKDDAGKVIDCSWSFRYQQEAQPIDNLVIYFSGGGMKCSESHMTNTNVGIGKAINHYYESTTKKYITVAACVVEEKAINPTSDHIPFYLENKRVDLLIKNITDTLKANHTWSGKNLLLTGVSHGAAALMLGFARSEVDHNPHMKGSDKTGVCLIDGPYSNIIREENYQTEVYDNFCNGNAPNFNGTRRQNICNRYRVGERNGEMYCHKRRNFGEGDSECPSFGAEVHRSCSELKNDDLTKGTSWDSSNLSHSKFKMISCGDGLDICRSGGAPVDGPSEAEQKSVCKKIEAESGKSCEFEHYNNLTHNNCATDSESINSCKSWFEKSETGRLHTMSLQPIQTSSLGK